MDQSVFAKKFKRIKSCEWTICYSGSISSPSSSSAKSSSSALFLAAVFGLSACGPSGSI